MKPSTGSSQTIGLFGIGVVHQVAADEAGGVGEAIRVLIGCREQQKTRRDPKPLAARTTMLARLVVALAGAEVDVDRAVGAALLVGCDLLDARRGSATRRRC